MMKGFKQRLTRTKSQSSSNKKKEKDAKKQPSGGDDGSKPQTSTSVSSSSHSILGRSKSKSSNASSEPSLNNGSSASSKSAGTLSPQVRHPVPVSPSPANQEGPGHHDHHVNHLGNNAIDIPRKSKSFERMPTPTKQLDTDHIKTPQRHSSSRIEPSSDKVRFEQLPSFTQVIPEQQIDLFLRKTEQCCIIFDFYDPSSDIQGKELKRLTLQELINFVADNKFSFTDQIYDHVVTMFKRNIFRPIPPPVNPVGDIFDPDEDEPVYEMAWPHMQLVYEFLLKFLESPDFNHVDAKPYIDHKFVLTLLDLFDSEDPNERECLKTVLHRLYGKFLNLRSFIRKSINNVFLQFVYETGRFNGISELLEILGSIINGFAVPLKEEHKIFLCRILMPMHKVRCLSLYHPALAYCIVQFLQKEPTLTEEVIMGLLRFWPKTNSPKELMFLNEIEDIFEVMKPSEFVKVEVPLFAQLSKCISSMHFQVKEKVLNYWCNDFFLNLVIENAPVILPIVFASLFEVASQDPDHEDRERQLHDVSLDANGDPLGEGRGNWINSISALAYAALTVFMEADPDLYDHCAVLYEQQQRHQQERTQARKDGWSKLEQSVKHLKAESSK